MPATRTQKCGCGRGVFGLIDWTTPLRRPAALKDFDDAVDSKETTVASPVFSPLSPAYDGGSWADHADQVMNNEFQSGQLLYVKYSYAANAESPLGEPELSVVQKEKVTFMQYHPENGHWAKVQCGDGRIGYIPANYVVLIDENVNSLPWLQQEVQQQKAEYKPYKSAYNKDACTPKKTEYACELCHMEFNGPQPYKSHMSSRRHREEVEARQEYDSN